MLFDSPSSNALRKAAATADPIRKAPLALRHRSFQSKNAKLLWLAA
jgi:hypothetical protein